MPATCVVQRDTGQTGYDPATHQSTPIVETVYSGSCRVQPARVATAELVQMFGQQITGLTVVGAVPVTMTDLRPDDVVQVTDSPDPGQVGKEYKVQAVHASSAATSRRFIAADDQG